MKQLMNLFSVLVVLVVLMIFDPALGKPPNIDGVFISSMNGKAAEICSCIKSGSNECLYSQKETQPDQIILFGKDTIILPSFELGCTVDVVGNGKLAGGNIDHYVGVCLSPGGVVNFSGYLMYDEQSKLSIAGITGPSHVIWSSNIARKAANGASLDEISSLLDSENGVNSGLLNIEECLGISPRIIKKLFEPKF